MYVQEQTRNYVLDWTNPGNVRMPHIANATAETEAEEIEVTPEMIEAGADELMGFALPEGGREEWKRAAAAAYRMMAALKAKDADS